MKGVGLIRFARIAVDDGVSRGCRRCEGEGSPGRPLPVSSFLERVTATVSGWDDPPGPNILIDGAEPFRHPALPELVQGAIDAGVKRLAIRTDAEGLGVGGNAEGAVAAGLRQVHVPLYAGDADLHDDLVGRRGSFEAVVAGLRGFQAAAERQSAAVLIVGEVLVCEHTLPTLAETVGRFAAEGAACVRLDMPGDSRRIGAGHLRAAFETGMVNGVWVWSGADGLDPTLDGHSLAPFEVFEAVG